MRSDRPHVEKTHLTSLAATTGIVVFVAWMACFALQHGSLFTRGLTTAAPAANQAQVAAGANPG